MNRRSRSTTRVLGLGLGPVIGLTIAGVLVCLVALSVSLHVCVGTIGFFWVYRLVEDYLLVLGS